jgi:ArsR family metal-binding transcriptional regulator
VSKNFVENTESLDDDMLMDGVTTYSPPPSLSDNRTIALQMMADIETLFKKLPGIDCGSCGSPTCRAFAADVIKGSAAAEDCVFLLREKLSTFLSSGKRRKD